MANVTLLDGYPSPDAHFLNERYLPAHSRTIFVDGLFKSDFSQFMGRVSDQIDLSVNAGAVICTPPDIQRMAGNTNVITYRMTRGFMTEALVNYRGSRLGKEEELWEDRAQVPLYTFEKYGSLGDWQGTIQAFDKKFQEVKPWLLSQYQRAMDWMFYRMLLYNDSNAVSIVDSSGCDSGDDYFSTSVALFTTEHLDAASSIADLVGVTAPNVFVGRKGDVWRRNFPVLAPQQAIKDFQNDTDITAIFTAAAGGPNLDLSFNRLIGSYLGWDFYQVVPQNGSTGHLGHPLWPMAIYAPETLDTHLDGSTGVDHYDALASYFDGTAGKNLTVARDTASDTTMLEAALPTDWLRDWPQNGHFWLPVLVDAADDTTFEAKCLIKFGYTGHNDYQFLKCEVLGHAKWPSDASDVLDGTEGVDLEDTAILKAWKGGIIACPYGYALGLGAHSIIYAPAPGEAPRYVAEVQDYQTRRGVGIQGAAYFGPRINYQRAVVGPIIMRYRMAYPYLINGASLFPKLITAKSVSYWSNKPYVGGTGYDAVGPGGDGADTYTDPTDLDPGNTGESVMS